MYISLFYIHAYVLCFYILIFVIFFNFLRCSTAWKIFDVCLADFSKKRSKMYLFWLLQAQKIPAPCARSFFFCCTMGGDPTPPSMSPEPSLNTFDTPGGYIIVWLFIRQTGNLGRFCAAKSFRPGPLNHVENQFSPPSGSGGRAPN